MPKIPRAFSSERRTTQAPEQFRSGTSGRGRALSSLGNAVNEFNETFRRANNLRQQMSAGLESNKSFLELDELVQGSDDLDSVEQMAEKHITDNRNRIAKTITDRETRDRFLYDYDINAQKKMFSVKNDLRKRQLVALEATANLKLEGMKQDYYKANTSAEKGIIKQQMATTLLEMSQVGAISQTDVTKTMSNINEELRLGDVLTDIEADPEFAAEELAQGKSGAYAHLSPEERSQMVSKAERLVKVRQAEQKRAFDIGINSNEQEFAQRLGAGERFTESELRDRVTLWEAGDPNGLSKSFVNSIIKAQESPKAVTAVDNPKSYDDLLSEYSIITDAIDRGDAVFTQ